MDEPRRPRRGAAAGLRAHRRERRTAPFAAVADAGAQDLRRAVPPRGRAHAARRARSSATSCSTSAAASRLDDGVVRRRGGRARSARRSATTAASICGLSGGVDSSVAAALLHSAIGDRLTCIFVDNGLLRAGEREQVESHVPRPLQGRPARRRRRASASSTTLAGRHRPRAEAQDHRPRVHRGLRGGGQEARATREFLAQGTLYPDVIERVSFKGPSRGHQEPPQRRRPARAHEARAGRAAARAVQGRGARARRASSACRATCCGASRSRARASRCAASAR